MCIHSDEAVIVKKPAGLRPAGSTRQAVVSETAQAALAATSNACIRPPIGLADSVDMHVQKPSSSDHGS